MEKYRKYKNLNKKTWVKVKIDEIVGDGIYLSIVLDDEIVTKRNLNHILKIQKKILHVKVSDLVKVISPDNIHMK